MACMQQGNGVAWAARLGVGHSSACGGEATKRRGDRGDNVDVRQ
jgi:hypothetical protein